MQSDFLKSILMRLTDIEFNRGFFVKLGIIYGVTILKFVSAIGAVRTQTELGAIITQSVHCLYCNPGYYPHGLLWYAIVIPISYFGTPTSDLIVFATIDMVILILLVKRQSLYWPFLFASFYDYFVIPQNEPVLWLTILGIWNPIYLAFSILAKLPVGAPKADWDYIFHTSLNITTNYQADYGVLVAFWLWILAYYYRYWIKLGYRRLRHGR